MPGRLLQCLPANWQVSKLMNGFMKEYFRRNGSFMGWTLLVLVLFWVVLLIILPQISMLDFSFRNHLPPRLRQPWAKSRKLCHAGPLPPSLLPLACMAARPLHSRLPEQREWARARTVLCLPRC